MPRAKEGVIVKISESSCLLALKTSERVALILSLSHKTTTNTRVAFFLTPLPLYLEKLAEQRREPLTSHSDDSHLSHPYLLGTGTSSSHPSSPLSRPRNPSSAQQPDQVPRSPKRPLRLLFGSSVRSRMTRLITSSGCHKQPDPSYTMLSVV